MQSVHLTLPSAAGHEMAATIDFPDRPPVAYAVFAHCFAGSRHTPGASRISKRLTSFGIATLRFDFPGLGQSGGDFAETSFSENAEDIKAAYRFLEENYSAPQLLLGHSLGGAATLLAATDPALTAVRAVAVAGAPFDPAHSVLHYADKIGEVDETGAVPVTLGGQELVISRGFLEDLAETNPESYLPRMRKPMLLVHSPIDQTVGIDNAQNIYRMTRYPKSLVSLDGADHLLTRHNSAQRAADIMGNWAQRYIEPEFIPNEIQPGMVVTHSARGIKFGTVARSSFDAVRTDRTRTQGGKGRGHSALDLFMMSIASATSEQIQELAAQKRLDLDDVRVRISHVHGTTFERRISVTGDISEAAAAELIAKGREPNSITDLAGNADIMDVG